MIYLDPVSVLFHILDTFSFVWAAIETSLSIIFERFEFPSIINIVLALTRELGKFPREITVIAVTQILILCILKPFQIVCRLHNILCIARGCKIFSIVGENRI